MYCTFDAIGSTDRVHRLQHLVIVRLISIEQHSDAEILEGDKARACASVTGSQLQWTH